MTRLIAGLLTLACAFGCGSPAPTNSTVAGGDYRPPGDGSGGGGSGGNTVGVPPAGFGSATFAFFGTNQWPFNATHPLTGSIQGWDDWHNADAWVQLYPADQRFVVTASDWPRVEGPADLTAACNPDSISAQFDSCSFHFTEMKMGNYLQPAETGGTWFFHGTFTGTKNGQPLVIATF